MGIIRAVASSSLENSRKMKEKSHRAPRRCYESVAEALRDTNARRLDGYRLYNPSDLPGRWVWQAGRRPLRSAGRQRRRGLGAVQGPGHPAGPDRDDWPTASTMRGSRARFCTRRSSCSSSASSGCAAATPTATTPPGWSTTRSTSWCWGAIRSPGLGLASQPTLSRFENTVSARELRALMHGLADTVIAQQRRRLKGRVTRITLDLDPTDDPTHGQQEFAFFNGHYDTWCYLPVVATVTFNDEPAQFAVAAVLRPGRAPAGLGARGILRALLRKLRRGLPGGRVPGAPGWGLCQRQAVPVPGARTGRVRRGHGEQSPVGEARPAVDGPGPRARAADRPDRPSLWRDAVRGQDVVAQAARHPEGRGGPASRARAQEQSPVRGHQSDRPAPGGLRALLPARRRGEPAQGTASRAGAGPDQLLEVPGQPVPGPADPGRVHPLSGIAAARWPDGRVPTPRSPRCGSDWSNSPCGSSARPGASCCICR